MMSETSSTLADWAQLYHHPTSPFGCSSALTDSTVITTTAAAAASSIVSGPSPQHGTGGIEGRVGKSARRRSRASRRAPVTLLNTDTTNFRAMVQQFTGISSGSSSSSSSYSSSRNFNLSNGPLINFGFNDQFNQGGMVMPIGQSSYQHQQQQQQQQQYQRYDESMFNNNNNNLVEMNDGISFDGVSTRMMPKMSSTNNRVDGYFT